MGKRALGHLYVSMSLLMLFCCLVLFTAGPAMADPVRLPLAQKRLYLGGHAEMLRDPGGKLTIRQILSPPWSGRFQAHPSNLFLIGGEPEMVWLRLSFRGEGSPGQASQGHVLEIDCSELDFVDLYVPPGQAGGPHRHIKGHRYLDAPPGVVPFRNYSFKIEVPSGKTAVYYLRLSAYGPSTISLVLWKSRDFHAHCMHDYLIYGFIYGTLLCMAFYNLFIYFSLKHRIYLIYVFYMLSFLAYFSIFNGHVFSLFPLPQSVAQTLEWVLLGLSIYLSVTFCQLFLSTAQTTPRYNMVWVFFKKMGLAISVLGFLQYFSLAAGLANFCGVFGPINIVILGFIRLRQGFKPAIYYVLANISFIAGTTVYVLWCFNLFNVIMPAALFYSLGPPIEAVLLSFALAYHIRILENEKRVLTQTQARYKKASETDGLTGLFNKRYLLDNLEAGVHEANSSGQPLSFMILDVDNFKNYNDTHGHPAGDEVLKRLALVIRGAVRDGDLACRYGGEEFAVILPRATQGQAEKAGNRICRGLSGQAFSPRQGVAVRVTCSVGVAQLSPGESAESLVKRADQALYRAKERGKNQVVVSAS